MLWRGQALVLQQHDLLPREGVQPGLEGLGVVLAGQVALEAVEDVAPAVRAVQAVQPRAGGTGGRHGRDADMLRAARRKPPTCSDTRLQAPSRLVRLPATHSNSGVAAQPPPPAGPASPRLAPPQRALGEAADAAAVQVVRQHGDGSGDGLPHRRNQLGPGEGLGDAGGEALALAGIVGGALERRRPQVAAQHAVQVQRLRGQRQRQRQALIKEIES